MAEVVENLKELALALRAQRNALVKRAADLRRERGKLGDPAASDGYQQGGEFLTMQVQLEAVERAIADEMKRGDNSAASQSWPEPRPPAGVV